MSELSELGEKQRARLAVLERGLVVGSLDRQRDAPSRTCHLGGAGAASGAVPGAFRRPAWKNSGIAQGVEYLTLTLHTNMKIRCRSLSYGNYVFFFTCYCILPRLTYGNDEFGWYHMDLFDFRTFLGC